MLGINRQHAGVGTIVLGQYAQAPAKLRTWRGLATATRWPASINSAARRRSYPPVASNTTTHSCGIAAQLADALGVVSTRQALPSGKIVTSNLAFDTSIPTHDTGELLVEPSMELSLSC